MGLYLVDLHGINDADQIFVADIAAAVRWRDPRLTDLAGCVLPLGSIWSPRLQIVNRRDLVKVQADVVRVGDGGTVLYSQRGYGEFTVERNLEDFPFDAQELTIQGVSRYPVSDVRIVVDPTATGRRSDLQLSGWIVGEFTSETGTFLWEPQNLDLPEVSFSVQVSRQPSYFVWKLIVPLALVVMMSWAVFWIEAEIVPARLGLSATAILTIIAYQFALSNLLPRLPYLTRMDLFFIGSSALVFLGLVETVTTVALHRSGKNRMASGINRASRIVFPTGFLAILLTSFWF